MAALGYSWTNIAEGSQTKTLIDSQTGLPFDATIHYYIDAKLSSQSVANNRSVIDTRARITYSGDSFTSSNVKYSCTGCTSKDSGSTVVSVSNSTPLTGTVTVNHNANGVGRLTMSGAFSCTYASYSISVSGGIDLPTIARASKPTVATNPLTIGDTQVISTNRASSSFTHRITIEMGGFLQMYTDVGASVSWIADEEQLMAYMSSAYERTMTVTCVTYNGSTQVGSAQSTTFKLRVDTSTYKPVIGTPTLSDSNTVTSSLESDGTFIKGKSNLWAVIPLSVNDTTYGDTLASAQVSCSGATANYDLSGTTENIEFGTTVQTNSMAVKATDMRGFSVSKNVPITLLEYSDISPISVSYIRVNESNVPAETGERIRYSIEVNVFCGSFGRQTNTVTVKSRSKTANVSVYDPYVTEQVVTTSGNGMDTITITGVSQGTYESTGQYDILFTVEDALSTAEFAPLRIHEGIPVYAWGRDHFDVFGTFHAHDREDANEYLTYGLDYNDEKSGVLCYTHGYITSGGNVAVLYIPLLKLPIDPKITALVCSVRTVVGGSNGYLGGQNNTDLASKIESIQVLKEQSALRVLLRDTSGFGITNNTPLCGEVTITYERNDES